MNDLLTIHNLTEINAVLKDAEKKLTNIMQRPVTITIQADNEIDYFKLLIVLCETANITVRNLFSPSRERDIVAVRHVGMYLMHKLYGVEDDKIADFFDRDRTSVYNAIQRMQALIDVQDPLVLKLIKSVQIHFPSSKKTIKNDTKKANKPTHLAR